MTKLNLNEQEREKTQTLQELIKKKLCRGCQNEKPQIDFQKTHEFEHCFACRLNWVDNRLKQFEKKAELLRSSRDKMRKKITEA